MRLEIDLVFLRRGGVVDVRRLVALYLDPQVQQRFRESGKQIAVVLLQAVQYEIQVKGKTLLIFHVGETEFQRVGLALDAVNARQDLRRQHVISVRRRVAGT